MPPAFTANVAKLSWADAVRTVRSHSTIRGALALAGCTAVGAVAMMVASPILTRLFTPEAFGMIAVYTSIVSVFATIGCLRYDLAILLPEDDETAVSLLMLSLAALVFICAILSLLVWLMTADIVEWLSCRPLAPYLWTGPIGVLGGGAYQALSCWALRKEAFGEIARTKLSQNAGMLVTQIGLGEWMSGSPGGLLAGDLVSRFGGVGALLRYSWPSLRRSHPGLRELATNAVRYRRFPLYSAPASLLTAVSTQIPVIMLSRYFGPAVTGWYALTYRVLRAPAVMVGQAAAQSLFAGAAKISRDQERLRALTEKTAIVLVVIGLPVFALVVQEGSDVFATLFGVKWQRGGLYAQILSPWFFVSFVCSPLSNLLTVREWQATTLVYSALECAVISGCLYAGARFHSDTVAMALLGSGACLLSLVTVNRFFQAGRTNTARVLKKLTPLLLPIALCFALTELRLGGTRMVPILLRILAFSVVYLFSVWKLGLLARV
jgi:lipopolysaccharide exporter